VLLFLLRFLKREWQGGIRLGQGGVAGPVLLSRCEMQQSNTYHTHTKSHGEMIAVDTCGELASIISAAMFVFSLLSPLDFSRFFPAVPR